jgi:hypothetical protein
VARQSRALLIHRQHGVFAGAEQAVRQANGPERQAETASRTIIHPAGFTLR